jgi:hypothetical protein
VGGRASCTERRPTILSWKECESFRLHFPISLSRALIFHRMVVIAVYALHIGHPGNLGKGRIGTSSFESKLSEEGRIEEAKQ